MEPPTYDSLFPWAWEGPVNPAGLHECALCGAAVSNQSQHVEWHNGVQADMDHH